MFAKNVNTHDPVIPAADNLWTMVICWVLTHAHHITLKKGDFHNYVPVTQTGHIFPSHDKNHCLHETEKPMRRVTMTQCGKAVAVHWIFFL